MNPKNIIAGRYYIAKSGRYFLCTKADYDGDKFLFKSIDTVNGHTKHSMGLRYARCREFIEIEDTDKFTKEKR